MKYLILAIVALGVSFAVPRVKREAYSLPDGSELIVGDIKTTFQCAGKGAGYYADVDNGCKIFHVCNPVSHPDGGEEVQHFSFYCGNLTVFNQLSLTCAYEEDAVPCNSAPDFYRLNERIGKEDEKFLTDEDVAAAFALRAR